MDAWKKAIPFYNYCHSWAGTSDFWAKTNNKQTKKKKYGSQGILNRNENRWAVIFYILSKSELWAWCLKSTHYHSLAHTHVNKFKYIKNPYKMSQIQTPHMHVTKHKSIDIHSIHSLKQNNLHANRANISTYWMWVFGFAIGLACFLFPYSKLRKPMQSIDGNCICSDSEFIFSMFVIKGWCQWPDEHHRNTIKPNIWQLLFVEKKLK